MVENETKDLYLTVPAALYDALKSEADRQGQTLAAFTRHLLNNWADSQTEHGKLLAKVLSTEAIPEV